MKLTDNIPFWEYKAEFEAKVPYSFIGWFQSKDLSKIDNLNNLLDNAYNKIANTIENKDNVGFKKLVAKSFEVDVMLYEKQVGDEGFQPESEIVLPINCSKIGFYGNNRLIRYETKELESCFKTEVKLNEGKKEIYTYPIFFHIPQGSNELEVIR
ncbi:hypothetical protein [Empedobacter tilapiae]